MNGSTFLQLFLLIDVFFIGAIAATAVRHAYAHVHPTHEPEPEKTQPHPAAQNGHLPSAVREHMLEVAQANLQTVLDRAAAQLTRDLNSTEARLTKQMEKLGTDIVGKEMERYHAELDKLRQEASQATGGAQAELNQHQAELKAKMAEEVEAEKQRLLQQLDTKLADAVTSFLLETLQHNVDLGAQSDYLIAMLDEHKDDFKRRVGDEAPTAK